MSTPPSRPPRSQLLEAGSTPYGYEDDPYAAQLALTHYRAGAGYGGAAPQEGAAAPQEGAAAPVAAPVAAPAAPAAAPVAAPAEDNYGNGGALASAAAGAGASSPSFASGGLSALIGLVTVGVQTGVAAHQAKKQREAQEKAARQQRKLMEQQAQLQAAGGSASGGSWLPWILGVTALAAVGGGVYYVKVYKPKQGQE